MDNQVNRAKLLWDNWEEKASKIQELTGTIDDKQTQKYKYNFLKDGLQRLSVNPSEKEKLYVHAINIVTAKLRKQLYPNPIVRFLHRIKNVLMDKPIHLLLLKEWKKETVNELQGQLKGFGLQYFAGKLEKELDYEREKIDLKSLTNVNGNDKLEVNVHLEKVGETGYQFNGYTATLTKESGEVKSATFSPENNIKLTEALNLLQGRPIFKSMQDNDNTLAKNWVQLEQSAQLEQGRQQLISFSPDYDFDLKKILTEMSIQSEIYRISMDAVRRGIEAGNSVAFEVPGKGKFFISANPSEKSVNFFDAEKKPISFAHFKKIAKPIIQVQNKNMKLVQQKDIESGNQLQVSH